MIGALEAELETDDELTGAEELLAIDELLGANELASEEVLVLMAELELSIELAELSDCTLLELSVGTGSAVQPASAMAPAVSNMPETRDEQDWWLTIIIFPIENVALFTAAVQSQAVCSVTLLLCVVQMFNLNVVQAR